MILKVLFSEINWYFALWGVKTPHVPKDAQVFLKGEGQVFLQMRWQEWQQARIRKMFDDLKTESSVDGDEVGDVFRSDSEGKEDNVSLHGIFAALNFTARNFNAENFAL